MTQRIRVFDVEQIVEGMHDLGLLPDSEYLMCGDVSINANYNGPDAGRVTVDLHCVATEKFSEALKKMGEPRER